MDLDPTFGDRHTELTRQALLADLEAFVDRLITAIASNDPHAMATFADLVAVRYRKRKISMDDVVTLCEGLRRAARGRRRARIASPPSTRRSTRRSTVFKWHRRLAGDARKRNPLLAFIYKGA